MSSLFAFTVFWSAFLLFLVQPLIGKVILPWFGGTPAVWNTCMVYFQSILVAGYGYAHYLAARLHAPKQAKLHVALLGTAVLVLAFLGWKWGVPLIPDQSLRPADSGSPVLRIVLILSLSVGLPYFVLSSTGPLLQAWFARLNPGRDTYRLYALSNLGSLLALLAYPFVVEPLLSVRWQGGMWALGFVLFALPCAVVALRAGRVESEAAKTPEAQAVPAARPELWRYLLWIALAACASCSLLATTNRISNEIAPVPFLWVVPLALYLLTFILCFESDRWYRRLPVLSLLLIFSLGSGAVVLLGNWFGLGTQAVILAAGHFLLCMACHGELARMRPAPAHLTAFYLMVSIGGALGGAFVSLLAPSVFDSFAEFPLTYMVSLVLVAVAISTDRSSALHDHRRWIAAPVLAIAVLGSSVFMGLAARSSEKGFTYRARNFYGVLRVKPSDPRFTPHRYNSLIHGRIDHGGQLLAPGLGRTPTSYFWKDSGVGLAIRQLRREAAAEGRPLRVGIIGLGIGVLAAYAEEGDVFRMYEIDPEVIRLAQGEGGYFSFLSDAPATIEVVEGDARNSLEAELRNGQPGRFDLLVLDAYSGDAIPSHLLTVESLRLYESHLRDESSMLALHTTNMHLDVRAVVERLAPELKLHHLAIDANGDPYFESQSRWELLSRRKESLAIPELAGYSAAPPRSPPVALWTDDYRNLLEIVGQRPFVPWNELPDAPAVAGSTE